MELVEKDFLGVIRPHPFSRKNDVAVQGSYRILAEPTIVIVAILPECVLLCPSYRIVIDATSELERDVVIQECSAEDRLTIQEDVVELGALTRHYFAPIDSCSDGKCGKTS